MAGALPIPDSETPIVASALHEQIFLRFGIPEQLTGNQGTQFKSELMTELWLIWGVKTHTTPYRPQGNGFIMCRTTEGSTGGLGPPVTRYCGSISCNTPYRLPELLRMVKWMRVPVVVVNNYASELGERMSIVHEELRLNQK